MSPVIAEVNETAIQPYMKQEIEQEVAIKRVLEPVRRFMFKYTREKDFSFIFKIGTS